MLRMWLVIGVLVLLGVFWYRRSIELFYVSVRGGRVLLVRGRIPQALLNDFAAAVERPPVLRGAIRGVLTSDGAQIHASGDVDDPRLQRLRNVFRLYPTAQLRAAPRPERPSPGQVLGWAWLAWMFHRPAG